MGCCVLATVLRSLGHSTMGAPGHANGPGSVAFTREAGFLRVQAPPDGDLRVTRSSSRMAEPLI